jgi:hypothetical protein
VLFSGCEVPRPGNVPDFGNRERPMKKESAALFEHAEEFNFAAHVSLSELKSSKRRKS